jgi:hypothetical protein
MPSTNIRNSHTSRRSGLPCYYPFGMQMQGREFAGGMGYRWGFGSQECDNEVSGGGNSYTAEFWQYDSRLGRRWNVDPVLEPSTSDFSCFHNNPVFLIDPNGLEPIKPLVGTINSAIEQWRINGCTTVTQIRNYYENPPQDPYTRYVYTKSNGWIDLKHYFGAIHYGEVFMDMLEMTQCLAGYPSCYSYEDLPSNNFGGNAPVFDIIESTQPDENGIYIPDFTRKLKTGTELLISINEHFTNAGATNPESAINFSKLPSRERPKVPDIKDTFWGIPISWHTEEEKLKLIETGNYVPQNYSDKPIDLTRFPEPGTDYK